MNLHDQDIEECTRLAGNNKFELLLFRLGEAPRTCERELFGMGVKHTMTKTGKEWAHLQAVADQAKADGTRVRDKIAVVLTDLEMPEMDGSTLTRLIKQDARFEGIPVVIHSSLKGATHENHVKGVGADGYVAKFSARELTATLRKVLG